MWVAFAARAVLRILPTMQEARRSIYKGRANRFSEVILPVFRATAISWAVARYATQATEFVVGAGGAPVGALVTKSSRATTAVRIVADAAASAFTIAFGAALADAAAFDASKVDVWDAAARAFAAERATAVESTAFWSAVSEDARNVEQGGTGSDIAGLPLWDQDQPDQLWSLWTEMKKALHATGQGWQVWTEWYDDRLAGRFGEEERELAYVRIDNDLWKQGPAIVNAEILRLVEESVLDSFTQRLLEIAANASPPPTPIENIPSAVSFGWTPKATISLVSGPENWPTFPFKGGEQDHKHRLEACRALATDTAQLLRSERWNARPDYAETLEQYVSYLPVPPEEGNFLLADAEARIVRAMFAGDADMLPVPLAAKLKVLLEQHIGLRAYYPATEDFYESVRSGHLEAPLPIDAIENFIQVVRDNTPTLFEPNVPESLGHIAQPVPTISTLDANVSAFNSVQPVPPPDPLGPLDPIQEWRFIVASGANALWKVVKFGPVAYAGVEGWSKILGALGSHAAPIIAWLRNYLGG